MMIMLILVTGGVASMSYLLGRTHGYEASERHFEEANAFVRKELL